MTGSGAGVKTTLWQVGRCADCGIAIWFLRAADRADREVCADCLVKRTLGTKSAGSPESLAGSGPAAS